MSLPCRSSALLAVISNRIIHASHQRWLQERLTPHLLSLFLVLMESINLLEVPLVC